MDTKSKKLRIVFLLTCGLTIWNIVYLPSFFYVPFQNAFSLTNEQMGNLLSMYGILAVIGYFFGGVVADKFSPKWLMVSSTVLTGLLGLSMATFPSYNVLLVIYMGFGVTAVLLYWSAFVKAIRLLADEGEEGKLFGAFESFYGIVSLIFSYAVLLTFSSYIAENGHFEYVIISYCSFTIIIGILIALFYKPDQKAIESIDEGGFSFSLVPNALKLPVTWFNAIIVFALFMVISGAAYMNPYFKSVYAMPVTWATAVGIITKYGFRIVVSPIGGAMVDKAGRSSKVLIPACIAIIAVLATLIAIPQKESYFGVALVVGLVFLILFNVPRSCMYVPVAEVNINPKLLGTVVGIVSAIGYSSDIWIWKLFGRLLDTHGNLGYNYIFGIMIAASLLAMGTGIVYNSYLNRVERKENNIVNKEGSAS